MSNFFTTKPRRVMALRYDKNKPELLTEFVPREYRRFSDTEQTFQIKVNPTKWESIYDGEWLVIHMDTAGYEIIPNTTFHKMHTREG